MAIQTPPTIINSASDQPVVMQTPPPAIASVPKWLMSIQTPPPMPMQVSWQVFAALQARDSGQSSSPLHLTFVLNSPPKPSGQGPIHIPFAHALMALGMTTSPAQLLPAVSSPTQGTSPTRSEAWQNVNDYFDEFIVPEAMAPPSSLFRLFGPTSDIFVPGPSSLGAMSIGASVVVEGNEDDAVERWEPSVPGLAQMENGSQIDAVQLVSDVHYEP